LEFARVLNTSELTWRRNKQCVLRICRSCVWSVQGS